VSFLQPIVPIVHVKLQHTAECQNQQMIKFVRSRVKND